MQNSPGQVQLQSQLWSEDGVLRNADTIANDGNVFGQYKGRVAGAGTYSAIQILNPSGSGVTAFIDKFILSSASNALVGLLTADTAFANDPVTVDCMRVGQADGNVILDYNDQGVTQVPTLIGVALTGGRSLVVDLPYPIQLDAGKGIAWLTDQAATRLTCSVLLREFTT